MWRSIFRFTMRSRESELSTKLTVLLHDRVRVLNFTVHYHSQAHTQRCALLNSALRTCAARTPVPDTRYSSFLAFSPIARSRSAMGGCE